jgi:glutathione peroxidase
MLRSLLVAAVPVVLTAFAVHHAVAAAADAKKPASGPLQYSVKDIDGKDVDLSQYQGKVVMIVNVASRCGNTPQYKQLEELHKKYADKGLVILGFPANEFGKQEPGTDAQIKEFCTSTYNVDFPMFSKVVVKGDGIVPLYKDLTAQKTTLVPVKGEDKPNYSGPIAWNFEKFLIGRDGQVVARIEPKVKPDDKRVVEKIEGELQKK